jgi:sugar phosphate isomerase/epimerase
VELLVRDPDLLSVAKLEQTLAQNNLKIAGFGTSPMVAQDNLYLLSEKPAIREEVYRRLEKLMDIAACFRAPIVIGRLRGNVTEAAGCTAAQRDEIFSRLCDYGEKVDASILIEPQKKGNVNNLNTVAESLEWARSFDSGKLRLILDTYHMDVTEENQCASIQEAAGRIGFVHLSDTERTPPGSGHLDFAAILAAFSKSGYAGYYSMEILQKPDSESAARTSLA